MIGVVLYIAGWLWGVSMAFREGCGWGIGALLIPIVWLYYIVSRWSDTWRSLALAALGAALFFFGGGSL